MNLLISDKWLPQDLPQCEENKYIDLSSLKIRNCIGCFGCWTKTPGCCVIRDEPKKAVIIAYGAKSEEEKEIFRRLVARNAHNMLFGEWRIKFVSEEDRVHAIQEEVAEWEN